MKNIDIYKKCFVEGLEISLDNVENATMETIDTWDSIGQMSLIALVEDAFGIELEPEELMKFTSYRTGVEVLKKHGVKL